MNLCVILRRNGWPTPDEPQAAPRRSIEEGDRDRAAPSPASPSSRMTLR